MRPIQPPPFLKRSYGCCGTSKALRIQMKHQISLAEIEGKVAQRGQNFGATLPADRVVLTGMRSGDDMPSGIHLNLHDSLAQRDFETRMMRSANVVLHMVLEGNVQAWLDGAPIDFGRRQGQPVKLVMSALAHPMEFRRRVRRGDHLRKVSAVMSWEWLKAHGLAVQDILRGSDRRFESWIAPPRDVAQAEALLADQERQVAGMALLAIRKEALGMSLIRHAIESIATTGDALGPKEREKLWRMEAHANRPGPIPTLGEIATAGGTSISTMRRMFQKAYGKPVLSYVRSQRMEMAANALRAGASVADAALLAGYETPTAFATAFRLRLGVTPSRFRQTQS